MLLALVLSVPAWTQEAPSPFQLSQMPRTLWDDGLALAQRPAAWTAPQWGQMALGAGAVLATGLLLDRPVDQAVRRNPQFSLANAARNVAQLGGAGGLILMGGAYLGSSLLGLDQARSLWRTRAWPRCWPGGPPSPSRRPRPVHPVAPTRGPAPSSPSVPPTPSPRATLPRPSPWPRPSPSRGKSLGGRRRLRPGDAGGPGRLETRDHFTSDVLAGALLGTGIGRAVVRLNRGKGPAGGQAELRVVPVLGEHFRGIQVVATF